MTYQKHQRYVFRFLLLGLIALTFSTCSAPEVGEFPIDTSATAVIPPIEKKHYVLEQNVHLKDYFNFLDKTIPVLDTMVPFPLDEYLLVQHNSWIIDTLENTDYYRQKEAGNVVLDAGSMTILALGDTLFLPNEADYQKALPLRSQTIIDVNIPEFRLRIMVEDSIYYTFPVRVGQNRSKYLAMAGRKVDLRTHAGEGTIVRVNRKPSFINPSNNHPYTSTQRDDGIRTALPLVPWIEPAINGQRYGQLIHPTTNPVTLGKAYSNGCIGMAEGPMWRVYYYAPLGTKVRFRYDLEVPGTDGNTIQLPDIYPGYRTKRPLAKADLFPSKQLDALSICDCR
ncbi:L,D-transpeptidase [Lewinella cohaerens]|uniref:L,D-transpeptidase n=1 Tax=Lewinella cohaerens TaxID=70995 RepID=UPI000365A202|nr:L,D-transpeptidase [Lewinella cohaerens]